MIDKTMFGFRENTETEVARKEARPTATSFFFNFLHQYYLHCCKVWSEKIANFLFNSAQLASSNKEQIYVPDVDPITVEL